MASIVATIMSMSASRMLTECLRMLWMRVRGAMAALRLRCIQRRGLWSWEDEQIAQSAFPPERSAANFVACVGLHCDLVRVDMVLILLIVGL